MNDNIQIVQGVGISPVLKTALAMLDCSEDNPAYEEIADLFCEQKPVIEGMIRPVGAFKEAELLRKGGNDDLPVGRKVIYSLCTVGQEVSDYVDKCMKEDPLLGLLVDFMADSCLFSFEEQLKDEMKKYCMDKGVGIHRAYEAPNLIPMECQKDAWEILKAEQTLGISITSGFMLRPIKSNGHIYTLSHDATEFSLKHDCSACPMVSCPMRNMNLL